MNKPLPSARIVKHHPWIGFRTLLMKEIMRFWKVGFQTVGAPMLNALLYLLIFSHVLERHVTVYDNVPYTAFLVPGLIMMSVLQNAFSNTSSSLIQSKITGNLIFVLLPPLSWLEFFFAYVLAAMFRGLLVGLGILFISFFLTELSIHNPWWIIAFAILGGAIMGGFGLVAGIWADKFDQLAAFQNFLIMPLTMLSGVFYSIHSLPYFLQQLSHFNPFFYMIDGFRYGFFGQSDVSPWLSLTAVGVSLAIVTALSLTLLARGYKLRA